MIMTAPCPGLRPCPHLVRSQLQLQFSFCQEENNSKNIIVAFDDDLVMWQSDSQSASVNTINMESSCPNEHLSVIFIN